ncbi:MAG: discoidin domain-containing protein, partial [Candidatus Sericytochromatia bacterium]|nr:discoidin domain-containing protein [Candidatus Tanganyikabacteria bacterium]
SLRRLRARRLLLRDLRARFRACLEDVEEALARLDARETDAKVAPLAPPIPGSKPSTAQAEFVALREDVRNVEDNLLHAETEWRTGLFDHVEVRLSHLEAQLETIGGAIGRFEQYLADVRPEVPEEAAKAALAEAASEARETWEKLEPDIRVRIERELPRLLSKARADFDRIGAWAQRRLASAEEALRDSRDALDAGALERADRLSRKARGIAGGIVRFVDLGIVPELPPRSRNPIRRLSAMIRDARLAPVATVGWIAAAMVFSAWLTHLAASRVGRQDTKVLTTSGNLALNRPTRASHELDAGHSANKAVDGNLQTGWISGASLTDDQALIIDLQQRYLVGKVLVLPQAAPRGRCSWEVDFSDDLLDWVRTGKASADCAQSGSRWGITEASPGSNARYVRIRPISWGRSGVSILEIRVFSPSQLEKD